MYPPETQTKMTTNSDENNPVFLYEVVMQPQMGKNSQTGGLFQRRGRLFIKVPYERMNQEMQRIIRSGGKIVRITPLTDIQEPPKLNKHLELPWWVEISTNYPLCIYYFGPFDNREEAQISQTGYVEDLQEEGAQGISINIKQCQPQALTQELDRGE